MGDWECPSVPCVIEAQSDDDVNDDVDDGDVGDDNGDDDDEKQIMRKRLVVFYFHFDKQVRPKL